MGEADTQVVQCSVMPRAKGIPNFGSRANSYADLTIKILPEAHKICVAYPGYGQIFPFGTE